jgi:drug/metabolite transporter (DMT)-like permease
MTAHHGLEATSNARLARGVFFGMLAGLMWGVIFSVPVLLPEYPPLALSAGRYLAFGLIVLIPAVVDCNRLRQLTRADWLKAAELALVGNLLYYCCIAYAAQNAGAPMTAMVIGTLPVVISLTGAMLEKQVRLRPLILPLTVISAGLALVHLEEWRHAGGVTGGHYGLGVLASLAALFCWTWYPVRNALWIKARPELSMTAWATAQGLATLPLALAAFVLLAALPGYAWPLGDNATKYLALMAVLGLCASWLGTLFWNKTSRLLPTALSGQMIVFETIFGMVFAFGLRREWPSAWIVAGMALLILGVILGVRAVRNEAKA